MQCSQWVKICVRMDVEINACVRITGGWVCMLVLLSFLFFSFFIRIDTCFLAMFDVQSLQCTFYLWLYGIRSIVKDHSDSERGHGQLALCGLIFLNSSKESLYAPSHRQDNTNHGICYTGVTMMDWSYNLLHYEWTLPWSFISLPAH